MTYLEREALARAKALGYLTAKFPDTDQQVFHTDYTGQIHADVIDYWAVAKAADIEATCATCTGKCSLTASSRPIVSIAQSARGYSFLDVSWRCGLGCKYQHSAEFERMFRRSGIAPSNQSMTFSAYECTKSDIQTRKARLEAMKASENGTCLILAGKPGTGKTHLAVAIAMKAMERGQQAVFRLVSAMLDEIQSAIASKGDYDGLMRQFKTVPCLVLDDLGHENMTSARASYLHQIIDYRYGENLQTIVTTNALTPEKLCALSGSDFVEPIISRLMGKGTWITISQSPDRRVQNAK